MKFKLIIISLILLVNVGFAFTLILSTFYQSESENMSKFSTIYGFFSGDELESTGIDFKKIVELLKQDKDIETKTIMAFSPSYSFHTNSKFIFTSFNEGNKTDTVEDFITKKNWSKMEHWLSSNNSMPPHKTISNEIPNYLIYQFSDTVIDPAATGYGADQSYYINSLIANPENKNLPDFLDSIYFSNTGRSGVVVYEVNLDD